MCCAWSQALREAKICYVRGEGGLEMEEAKRARWNLCKGGGGGKSVMKRVKATPLPIMPLLKNVHTHYLHSGHMRMKRSKRDGRLEFE